jgi:uncharacterized protein YqjF (DUF2071 family)
MLCVAFHSSHVSLTALFSSWIHVLCQKVHEIRQFGNNRLILTICSISSALYLPEMAAWASNHQEHSMAIEDIFQEISHRPWPHPAGNWVMAQQWHHLLFAHWPVPEAILWPHIPAELELDTYKGQAWLGVVPFLMRGVRLRNAPAVPGTSEFPELNVRTYVKRGGKPGVWFFSLDAANSLAVMVARALFHLPYFRARMRCEELSGWIEYESERIHRGAESAIFRGRYRGAGAALRAENGTLEHFLTERYCLYSATGKGQILRGEIHHRPWVLQQAETEIQDNSMAAWLEAPLPGAPIVHYSKRQDVVTWAPRLA